MEPNGNNERARRHVWWLPANALAWAVAMPVIFMGVGALSSMGVGVVAFFFIALTLVLAGAIAGALHGFALVCLLSAQGGSHEYEESTYT